MSVRGLSGSIPKHLAKGDYLFREGVRAEGSNDDLELLLDPEGENVLWVTHDSDE